MIVYKKTLGALGLLTRVHGSPCPRALLLALPSTVLAVLLSTLCQAYVSEMFPSATVFMIYSAFVTFCLVFRTNLSYNRYWEGCTSIKNMMSKWADATIQVIAFDEAAESDGVPGGIRFRSEFIHIMSLMHAMALQRLRGDSDFNNIVPGDFFHVSDPPPCDAADLSLWTKYRQKRSLFALRTTNTHFENYWRCSPFTVLGGVNASECDIMESTKDRVFLAYCWITRLLGQRRHEGGIKVEAPIISRIYQVLSDGMQGYENALKVATHPFPFPYAQSLSLLLLLNALIVPLVLARWAGPVWLVGVMTFVCVFSAYLVNEVAREIEDPFKYEPNDLPLMLYQHQFNQHLVTAFVRSIFPEDTAVFLDHIEHEDKMKAKVNMARPSSRRDSANAQKVIREEEILRVGTW